MAVHVLPLLRAAFTNPLPQSTNLMGIPFTTSFLFLPLMACDPNKPICQRAYRFTALYYFTNLSPIQVYIAISPPPNGPSGYTIFCGRICQFTPYADSAPSLPFTILPI